MENLVQALVNESSVKNRRPIDVTIAGLATMPRSTVLPIIDSTTSTQPSTNSPKPRPSSAPRTNRGSKQQVKLNNHATVGNMHYIKRQTDVVERFGKTNELLSTENWIPEETRMRSLHRDIAVAKVTLGDIQKREMGQDKELKRLRISDFKRAQIEEDLGAVKKIPCACCELMFLYVNLPLKVSRKAIMDIRTKWSGQLSSANVFGGGDATESPGKDKDTADFKSIESGDGGRSKKSKDLLSVMYNEVRVCFFCAQFFHVQEAYRPSFSTIVFEEKKAAYNEQKAKEKQYWDPLKMVEKDREILEQRQKEKEALMAAGNLSI
jgi:hypothetical protein